MRRFLLFTACLLLTLLAVPAALAETYTFSGPSAALELNAADYDAVLTPYNLAANAEWIAGQGIDTDALTNAFENEGILLQAYDKKNGRTLVITALQDVDAQTYFDLNNQDENMRKEFRQSHTNGTAYSVLGYSYSSAKWKNYGGTTLRFLQTKYSLRQGGEQVCTGYQRRTIRNGYTITLDLQVTGRAARDADDAALEKIMKGFSFTQVLPMPPLPVKLSFTSAPPAETSDDTFTIKGTTAKKGTVTVTVFSLGETSGNTYTDTASSSGAFSVKVTLPSQGVYSVSVTAQAEGELDAQRTFSVTYQKGMLPVELSVEPAATLGDETLISGTTLSGAKTQVSVSGPLNYTKTSTSKNFSFKLDTSVAGTYQIAISVTMKGMNERRFTYTATRTLSEVEQQERIRAAAKSISYANLSKPANEGKYAVVTGYVTGVETTIGEWLIPLALKESKGQYSQIVYLICTQEPAFAVGDKVKAYGTASGTYSKLVEGGTLENYPRLQVAIIEAAQ